MIQQLNIFPTDIIYEFELSELRKLKLKYITFFNIYNNINFISF